MSWNEKMKAQKCTEVKPRATSRATLWQRSWFQIFVEGKAGASLATLAASRSRARWTASWSFWVAVAVFGD